MYITKMLKYENKGQTIIFSVKIMTLCEKFQTIVLIKLKCGRSLKEKKLDH
jgi:ABC-type uncharacterized transport system ATPase subunit